MGAPLVYAGIAAASAIYGGISASRQARNNAAQARLTASYNAQSLLDTNARNTRAASAVAGVNAAMSIAGANMGASVTEAIGLLNAGVQRQVGEYGLVLAEQDARQIWKAVELDVDLYDRRMDEAKGLAVTQYGASGVVIGEPGDAPMDYFINFETERQLQEFVLREDADYRAQQVLDAGVLGQWEQEVLARKMTFEARMNGMSQRAGGILGAAGEIATTNISNSVSYANSVNDANNVIRGGTHTSNQYRQQGQQALVSGVIQAGTIMANYKANPKQSLLS